MSQLLPENVLRQIFFFFLNDKKGNLYCYGKFSNLPTSSFKSNKENIREITVFCSCLVEK